MDQSSYFIRARGGKMVISSFKQWRDIMHNDPILVIGASGKTGRRVVNRLVARGHTVRAVSRSTQPTFDWQDPDGWAPVLKGAKAAYVTYHPDLAMPQAAADIQRFTDLAMEAGLSRLVLLSGRGETGAKHCEDIVLSSGLDATVVRASWFFQNFNEGPLLGAVREGVIAMPAGMVREPFVDADDIADMAVTALTNAAHAGQVLEVTGPALLTFTDVAAELSRTLGRDIHYAPISLDQFNAAMAEREGKAVADLLTHICAEVFDGRNAHLSGDVERVLARPARAFSTYCQEVAQSGVWSPVDAVA